MSKFYSISLALLAVASLNANANLTTKHHLVNTTHTPTALAKKNMPARKSAVKVSNRAKDLIARVKEESRQYIWCPQSENDYSWDDSDWTLTDSFTYAYDNQGLCTSAFATSTDDDGTSTYKLLYSYNENGTVKEVLQYNGEDPENMELAMRLVESYDELDDTFCIDYTIYSWNGEDWEFYYREVYDVVRDSNNNILSVTNTVTSDGESEEESKVEYTYAADGSISTAVVSDWYIDYDEWAYVYGVAYTYTNMSWDSLDATTLFSSDYFYSAPNHLSAYTLTDYEEDYHTFAISYESADSDNYSATASGTYYGYGDDYTLTHTEGEYGSYTEVMDYVTDWGDGETEEGTQITTVVYDSYGLLIEDQTTVDGDIYECTLGEVTYDDTYGFPLTYISSEYDYWYDEMTYSEKKEYSNYIDAATGESGVNSIATDNNEEATYFNINGVRVNGNNLTPGVYVRRQGNNVTKVIVK